MTKHELSKNGNIIIDRCESAFGDWLKTLQGLPATTQEWKVGMNWLEMILCQVALAKGGSEALEMVSG